MTLNLNTWNNMINYDLTCQQKQIIGNRIHGYANAISTAFHTYTRYTYTCIIQNEYI